MKNIPKKIYLQLGEEDCEFDAAVTDFNTFSRGSVTWCSERINDNDIEYILNQES